MTFGRKINLSGISPVIRTKFGIRGHVKGDNVQGILGAIGPFWAKWGLGRVSRSAIFFCVVIHATFRPTSQQPIFTTFGHET